MVDDTDPAGGMTADQRRQVAAYGPSGLGTFWKDLQTNRAPLIAAVQDQRLGSYLVDEGGKLWDAIPKPWENPDTTQAVLDTTALPAKAVVGMGKGLGSIIKEAVTNPTPKTSAEAALSVAGLGGGLAALGVGAKQVRSLGMFIGPHGAKNLGKDVSENLEKAKIMEKKADSNADPFWPTVAASKNKYLNENLRTNYGWHKNPGDNLWRLEIPTAENLKFKSEKYGVGLEDNSDGRYRYSNPTTKSPLRWDDILSFPDLEKAYPALKGIHLDVTIERGRKVPTGSHRPAFQKAPARIKVTAAPEDIKSVILHELQHFIQYQEGFAKGSGPRKMRELFKDGNKKKASGTPLPYELQEVQKWFKDAKVELRQLAKEHLATAQHMEERLPIVKDPKRTLEDREKIQTLREDAEKIENILTRSGATSSSFKDAYKQEMDTLATWIYAKHAGEVEAGIVQARMDLTPQQRLETPPTESRHLGQKTIPYTAEAKRFLERLEIPEQIVVGVGKTSRAHGGPIYASEALHMAKGGPPDLYEQELYMGIPTDEQIAQGQRNKEMIEEFRAQRNLAQRDAAIQEADLQSRIEGRPKGGSGLTGFDQKEAEYIQQSLNLIGGGSGKVVKKAVEEVAPLVRRGVGTLTRYVTGENVQENLPIEQQSRNQGLATQAGKAKDMFGPSGKGPGKKKLLVVSCSGAKNPVTCAVEASKLYKGQLWQALNKHFGGAENVPKGMEDAGVDLHILSAEHGLIPANKLIENYDQEMTSQRKQDLLGKKEITQNIADVFSRYDPEDVFVAAHKNYRQLIEEATGREFPTFKPGSGIGSQKGELGEWLRQNIGSRSTGQGVASLAKDATDKAHGGPVYASELLHMAKGGPPEPPDLTSVPGGKREGVPDSEASQSTIKRRLALEKQQLSELLGKPVKRDVTRALEKGIQSLSDKDPLSGKRAQRMSDRIKDLKGRLDPHPFLSSSNYSYPPPKDPFDQPYTTPTLLTQEAVGPMGLPIKSSSLEEQIRIILERETLTPKDTRDLDQWLKDNYGKGLLDFKPLAEAPGSRPKDPSNLPALIAKAAALSLPDEPRPKGKGQRFRGIGSLMRRRLFPLIQAAQLGYGHLLSPEQKAEIKDFLESPAHEMVGMDKPGIEYFKDLFGMSGSEPQGEGLPALAKQAKDMTSGPRSLALRQREELLNEVSKPLWPSSVQADLLRSTDQAPELPMDEASRMARAKELGFDDQEFYHLTDKDFDRFIPGGPSGVDDQGAVFVRPDPSRQQSSHNVVFTSEGAREIPVRIRRQETLYIDQYNRKEMIDRFKLNSEFPWIVKTEEARRLRDIGFDNVELELDGKVEEIAILDPKNIRSRFAGFDPAKRGSAKLDKAHGGPVYASEALHMQGGGEGDVQEYLRREMLKVNEDSGPRIDPTVITLPEPLESLGKLRIGSRKSPLDPRLPERGPSIEETNISYPIDNGALITGSRTVVPRHSVGSTPSGGVNLKAEERGIRVDNFPVANFGPFWVSLNAGISERDEKISGPEIAEKIPTELVDLGVVASTEDVRVHAGQTTQRGEGRPSQKTYRGGVIFRAYKGEDGTVDVFLEGYKPASGPVGGSLGIRGGFKFAGGGLASMAPEARAMFGKPRSMGKEPRPTALSPGTNPGVAGLCGVARNMNRSVVA